MNKLLLNELIQTYIYFLDPYIYITLFFCVHLTPFDDCVYPFSLPSFSVLTIIFPLLLLFQLLLKSKEYASSRY